MEPVDRFRAFYINDKGEKEYLRKGKFYNKIGQCKAGIRCEDWCVKDKRVWVIERWQMKWVEDVETATITRNERGYHNAKYEVIG